MLTTEQITAAHKANLDTLFSLTSKTFEGIEKLVELNMQVAKTAIAEALESTQSLMAVKDAQELVALQSTLLQPSAEKAASYSRHLYDIVNSTNVAVSKVAEAQIADVQAKFSTVLESAAKNAPAGSENAVAMVKTAVAAANSAFESIQQATRQASEVAEANFEAAADSAVKATQTAARNGKRAAA